MPDAKKRGGGGVGFGAFKDLWRALEYRVRDPLNPHLSLRAATPPLLHLHWGFPKIGGTLCGMSL